MAKLLAPLFRLDRHQIIAGFLLLLHVIFSMAVLPKIGRQEVFPFYDWSLYTSFGGRLRDVALGISYNGKFCYLNECPDLSDKFRGRPFMLGFQGAYRARSQSPSVLEKYLASLHRDLWAAFPGGTLMIRERLYLPKERFLDGKYVEEIVLKSFVVDKDGIKEK